MYFRPSSLILHSSSIRLRSIAAATLFGLSAAASATVTINFAFGELRDSSATVLTDGLWAMVVGSGLNLPGGLSVGSSLDSADGSSAWSAFSGKNITAGTSIGSFTVVATGDDLGSGGLDGVILESYTGLQTAGQSWGLYWFPTLTVSNATLGSGTFEVGGFFETVPSPESEGDDGMVIPSDGATAKVQYLESSIAPAGPNLFTPARFTAITTVTPAFHWDTDVVTAGAQGGSGTWNTTTPKNWNVGTSNYVWADTGTNNDAIFGGTAGTVTIAAGGVTANELTFNTTGYTITGGTLTLNGTTPTVTTATGVTATISSAIQGTAGLTKEGAGTLILGAPSGYTGATLINEGKLEMGDAAADNFATTSVVVGTGGKLAGRGTVAGATTVGSGGKYSAGALGAVGEQTFSSNLNLQPGSIFEWDLTSADTASGFDKVTVNTGTLTGSGAFRVVTELDFSDDASFWTQTQTWNTIFNGSETLTGWSGSLAAAVYGSTGTLRDVATYGSFSISGTTLTWTAVPETSNVLIGALIGLGILRRRRR